MRRTKIVCTVGPASREPATVAKLIRAGVDVFRINFAHGDKDSHAEEIATIRSEARRAGETVAILQDLPGPKIRVGKIKGDSVELVKGSSFTLGAEPLEGDATAASLNYPDLLKSVRHGDILHVADGIIRLKVEERSRDGVLCTVVAGGVLSSGKGVNAPGVRLHLTYPTQADVEDLRFGLSQGVDMVGLSFVRSASDVRAARRLVRGSRGAFLVAKIEKREALAEFDAILAASDGVMVARGDLGIEVPIERVPSIQKSVVEKCLEACKPVIVATQMLVSMVNFPLPSRAEVTDVSTAILQGADAVMLSDETAVGRYPVEAVKMLDRISGPAERLLKANAFDSSGAGSLSVEEAVGRAACRLALFTGAKAIVAPTQSGSTARRVAKYRPKQPVLALCPDNAVAGSLKLTWGVFPFMTKPAKTIDELLLAAEEAAVSGGFAKKGDRIVITSGTPGIKGSTDLVKVVRVSRRSRGG